MSQPPASAAQPVICCVGESVSGQPTQFMIERAVASLGMDWRALSVEVPPDKFAAACQGMLAMGFKGLRLFSDYQRTAVTELAAEDPAVQFIGSATSGSPRNGRWMLWDYRGYAWLELMGSSHNSSQLVYWLHGDSLATRSLFVALVSLQSNAPRWFWTSPQAAEQTEFVQQWLSEEQPAEETSASRSYQFDPDMESLISAAKEAGHLLVYVAESKSIPVDHAELLRRIEVRVATNQSLDLQSADTIPVSHADLTVAGEAYDFRQWTGQKVDSGLLRDAYDEYCDFW